jgi:hypothetical protein
VTHSKDLSEKKKITMKRIYYSNSSKQKIIKAIYMENPSKQSGGSPSQAINKFHESYHSNVVRKKVFETY